MKFQMFSYLIILNFFLCFPFQPDGVYSVLLCDTNGEDDVYINDLLIQEGLAENSSEHTEAILAPVEPVIITLFLFVVVTCGFYSF